MPEGEAPANPLFNPASDSAAVAPPIALDPELVQTYLAELKARQSLVKGIAGGFVSALVGAVIWAAFTVLTHWQIGWLAVGIGFLVGLAVRKYGKGLHMSFGIAGGALSLFGCVLGNVLSLGGFIAQGNGNGVIEQEVMLLTHPVLTAQLLAQTFEAMDVLFYAIAIYEGYKFSFHEISQGEIAALARSSTAGEHLA